jgi:hypothetical protein
LKITVMFAAFVPTRREEIDVLISPAIGVDKIMAPAKRLGRNTLNMMFIMTLERRNDAYRSLTTW